VRLVRLGPFTEKHGIFAIFHNHFQYADTNFSADPILAISPAIMLNLDCGHYFGSTGLNPADFIRKYHNRIVNLHLKDKTGLKTAPPNANQVWGQGQIPLEEILLLLIFDRQTRYSGSRVYLRHFARPPVYRIVKGLTGDFNDHNFWSSRVFMQMTNTNLIYLSKDFVI
jgi:sugar phosphate isomerase/epimerase